MRRLQALLVLLLVGGVVSTGSSVANASHAPAVRELVGSFRLTPGTCNGGRPTGSYLSVTFGTSAIRNSSSNCAGGAITLLSPGSSSLSTQTFGPAISSPVRFDGQALVVSTAAQGLYSAPRLYLIGHRVTADVRSVAARYQGGLWPVGSQQATGHFDPRTRQLTLRWFSGQSFTPSSAGTEVQLVGRFLGSSRPLRRGTTVNLGSASFAAGASRSMIHSVAVHRQRGRPARAMHRHQAGRARLVADRQSTTTGSPMTFLVGELVVLVNLVTYVALARRRGRK